MTASPHTIGHDQPLATAKELMAEHRFRHLPVLEAGLLVGIVSQRDIAFIETLRDVDVGELTVSEAMSAEVYSVSAHEPLEAVAGEMARRGYGSAVVVDGTRVIGMFTTVDALRALQALLRTDAR